MPKVIILIIMSQQVANIQQFSYFFEHLCSLSRWPCQHEWIALISSGNNLCPNKDKVGRPNLGSNLQSIIGHRAQRRTVLLPASLSFPIFKASQQLMVQLSPALLAEYNLELLIFFFFQSVYQR